MSDDQDRSLELGMLEAPSAPQGLASGTYTVSMPSRGGHTARQQVEEHFTLLFALICTINSWGSSSRAGLSEKASSQPNECFCHQELFWSLHSAG